MGGEVGGEEIGLQDVRERIDGPFTAKWFAG